MQMTWIQSDTKKLVMCNFIELNKILRKDEEICNLLSENKCFQEEETQDISFQVERLLYKLFVSFLSVFL